MDLSPDAVSEAADDGLDDSAAVTVSGESAEQSVEMSYGDIDDEVFLDIIKKGFSSPRKKLMKNLVS